MRLGFMKKFLMLLGLVIPLSVAFVMPLRAADQGGGAGGGMGSFFAIIIQYLSNIVQPDNTKDSPTPQLQSLFSNLGTQYVSDVSTQQNPSLVTPLLATGLGQDVSAFSGKNPSIVTLFPNVNNVNFTSLLGQPVVPKASVSTINYIENAAGLSLPHVMPSPNWQGAVSDQLKYSSIYNTMLSIETFNGYVLSNWLAESSTGNKLTTLQNSLIQQASASTWIAQLASETIGQVLRQLLMFESQSYVLLTQMVQIERQMLAAQAMTNTLLILAEQNSEPLWVSQAQGSAPSVTGQTQ